MYNTELSKSNKFERCSSFSCLIALTSLSILNSEFVRCNSLTSFCKTLIRTLYEITSVSLVIVFQSTIGLVAFDSTVRGIKVDSSNNTDVGICETDGSFGLGRLIPLNMIFEFDGFFAVVGIIDGLGIDDIFGIREPDGFFELNVGILESITVVFQMIIV
ncbi:hypothetical protein DERP_006954 [Dermatophagoides pteronyssinus]|uniref:Uncharacterized protein n=1 Tax=Dermatophagoides pteronyssinus TaxID=6956 RepID=A0ABQ8JTU1_DERPT|nr:hypothetical protein DERP_006954 [Dermatophagoides pteronyssinus]